MVVVAPPFQKKVLSTEVSADQGRRVPGTQGDVLKVRVRVPTGGGAQAFAEEASFDVIGGAVVALAIAWADCPSATGSRAPMCGDGIGSADETPTSCPPDCTEPKGCTGAEEYARFDLATRQNLLARETMRVSWFAIGGTFGAPHTGASGGGGESSNAWSAPASGSVTFWVVLRDDRGGVSWVSFRARVS